MAVEYSTSADGVDWSVLKADLAADYFDNGRTPEQMERSFGASFRCVFGRDGQRIVGTGRVISYAVFCLKQNDMWTHSAYRRRGIGKRKVQLPCGRLDGQDPYLVNDAAG